MTSRQVVVAATSGPLVLAVLTLAAWATGFLRLASLSSEYIPMAPSTAIGFVITCAVILTVAGPVGAAGRRWAMAGVVPLASFAVLTLSESLSGSTWLNLEGFLVAQPGAFGAVQLGRMSPLTASAFLLCSVAMLCLTQGERRRARDCAGGLGAMVILAGGTVVLGYIYRAPLLYGGRVIPMALTTAVAFIGTGIALVAVAGPASLPLRPFEGRSARAQLLRLFLPLTTAAILLNGILTNVILSHVRANPALLAAMFALLSAAGVGAAVSSIARLLGGAIDEANVVLERSRDELEQRVQQRTEELSALNRELESFSYSVSHDLRAPLRHVLGFASLLEEEAGESLNAENRQYLYKVTRAASRMSDLIDDLLKLSRTTRAQLQKRPTRLATLISEAKSEVGAQIGDRSIAWKLHENLPDVIVDPGLFRLVLVNLLSNAVKYTGHEDAPRIEVGVLDVTDSGAATVFVRDNGVGFDMNRAGKLFSPFQRMHSAEEFEGNGVGLANVQRIMSRHGGRVWVEAAVGAGATFYLALPPGSVATRSEYLERQAS